MEGDRRSGSAQTSRFVPQMVKLLLNKGANLSAIDKKERQPIHCAAYLGKRTLFFSRRVLELVFIIVIVR